MIRSFLLCLLGLPVLAADDAACDAKLTKLAGARGATVKVCTVTERLLPNRTVVFAVLTFGEDSEHFGNRVLVLDGGIAAAGRRQVVFEEDRGGIELQPFLFQGTLQRLARRQPAKRRHYDPAGTSIHRVVRTSQAVAANVP